MWNDGWRVRLKGNTEANEEPFIVMVGRLALPNDWGFHSRSSHLAGCRLQLLGLCCLREGIGGVGVHI